MRFVNRSQATAIKVILLIGVVVALGGCATLGIVNPFSSGNEAFADAQRAWADGDYAGALSDAAYAIARDEKHYKAIQFLIDNYQTAIDAIDSELASLGEGEATYDSLLAKADIYYELEWFYKYIADEGMTSVTLERGKNSVVIPIRDISAEVAEVRTKGMELAEVEAMALIEAEQFEDAQEVVRDAASRFASDSDEAETIRATYADLFADRVEEIMADLTIENAANAQSLLYLARGLNRSDRIQALSDRLTEEAVQAYYAAADELVAEGTKGARAEALALTAGTRAYISDIDDYKSRRVPYVAALLEVWPAHIAEIEAEYDGTIDGALAIREEYNAMLDLAKGWPQVSFDAPAALAQMRDFVEASTTRIAVVMSPEFSSTTRDRLAGQLRSMIYDVEDQDQWYFLYTEDDISLEKDADLTLYSGADEDFQSLIRASGIFPGGDDDYLQTAASLSPDASSEELQALHIDYVVKLIAEVEELDLDTEDRTEEAEGTFILTSEGEFTQNPLVSGLLRPEWNRLLEENNDDRVAALEAFQPFLRDNDLEAIYYDVAYIREFEWEQGEQEIEIEVAAYRVSDDRRLFRDRFSTTVMLRSGDRLVDIEAEDRELAARILEFESTGSAPSPAGVSERDVTEALNENLEVDDLFEALTRS